MSTLRQLRNFWVLWVTTFVLACFGNAFAQASYQVTDLGSEGNDHLGCAMSVNDEGWTEIMAAGQQDNFFGIFLNGRVLIDVDGFKLDLGTLGGHTSWMNWGEKVIPKRLSQTERRRHLRLRHTPHVSPVSLATLPHDRSSDARRK